MMAALVMPAPADSVLRLPEVEKRTGLARSTLYRHMAAGAFPASVPIGTRNVGWLESEVQAWVAGLAEKSRAEVNPNQSGLPGATRDLGIASRIRRSEGRGARVENANARLTTKELDSLKAAAAAEGKALGEWTREVLLREARKTDAERALFTELVALRLLLTNVLRPLALGQTIKPEDFQAILAGVRNDKHDAAQQLLTQYQPKRAEDS